jgi:hypothetical protein
VTLNIITVVVRPKCQHKGVNSVPLEPYQCVHCINKMCTLNNEINVHIRKNNGEVVLPYHSTCLCMYIYIYIYNNNNYMLLELIISSPSLDIKRIELSKSLIDFLVYIYYCLFYVFNCFYAAWHE